MASKKNTFKTLLKLGFGVGVIIYVLRSNMIDFSALGEVLWSPKYLFLSMIFYAFSTLCISVRWYYLIRAQQLSLNLKDVFALTMIGNFFNTFMPGAVGGDLIKAWYIAGKEPTRKTKAVFTVLLDRLIGLAVVIFYAAVTLLLYFNWAAERPNLRLVGYFVWSFTVLCILFMAIFYNAKWWSLGVIQGGVKRLKTIRVFEKIIDASLLYQKHLRTVILSFVFTGFSIFSTIFLWTLQGEGLGIDMNFALYFLVVPLGMVASAIPILPGGLGVGQVAYFTLFQWVGMSNPEQGATLCTLLQIHMILFSSIGAIFYVRYKRDPKSKFAESSMPKTATSATLPPIHSSSMETEIL